MGDGPGRLSRLGLQYAVLFGAVAVIYPFFPIYLAERDLSPSRIGLVLGVMEVAALAGPFALAGLADRTGRFRSVMTLMAVLAAGGLAAIHRSSSFPVLLASAVVFGFSFKPLPPLVDALSGRVLTDSAGNYGKVRVWGTVSFIVVSMVLQHTGILGGAAPGTFMAAFMLSLAAVFAAIPAAPGVPPHAPDNSEPSPPSRTMPRGFWSFLLLGSVGNIGFAVYQSFGSLYFRSLFGIAAVSGLFALAAFTEIPTMLFGGKILRKWGHRRMIFLSQAACFIRLAVLAAIPHAVPIILSQFTHALVYGFFLITGVDWVNRIVPAERRALGMGLFMAVSFSGSVLIGSTLGGYLLEAGGFVWLFGVSALFPLAGMVWILADRRLGGPQNLERTGDTE